MDRNGMHPFELDPIDPPEGASEVERLLWMGLCPWCGQRGPFAPYQAPDDDVANAPPRDDSIVCRNCGLEFEGPANDQESGRPRRVVEKVLKRGDAGKRGGRPDDLPAVTERPKHKLRE